MLWHRTVLPWGACVGDGRPLTSRGRHADASHPLRVQLRRPHLAVGEQGARSNVDRTPTVLVVDDEATVRNVAVRILQRMGGYEAVSAEDGASAVALLEQDPAAIDLALVDMSMPGMDGAETVMALRRVRPDLAAILTSGYGEDETLARYTAEPKPGFLGKPYNPEGLVAAVRAVLG